MDSYVHAVRDETSALREAIGPHGGGGGSLHEVEEDEMDEDEDDCSSRGSNSDKTTDTAAGCSSVSDTDFYYEDCHEKHTTVVEIRDEQVRGDCRTEAAQEEFEDSLCLFADDRRCSSRRRLNWTEVVTKHRHVLAAESCRVKVQNLRYLFHARTILHSDRGYN